MQPTNPALKNFTLQIYKKLYNMTPELLEKRNKLKDLSNTAVEIAERKGLEGFTKNCLIMNFFYNPSGKLKFNTFFGWQKEGFKVKKGEKAFVLWGEPLKYSKGEKTEKPEPKNESEEDKEKFFPLAYVFSSEQVEPLKK